MARSMAAQRTAAIRAGMRSRERCPDVECGGDEHRGCEPWTHTDHALTLFWKEAVLNINPREGELLDMSVSLFANGSVGMYDGVNDECARVVRGNERTEVLRLMARDWQLEYLSQDRQDWIRKLAEID